MKISTEEVIHVARLARLDFPEQAREDFTFQLNRILDYIDKLNELDTTQVEPMSHPLPLVNALREDLVIERATSADSLAAAPAVRGNFFLVPKVIE
jgi:aspartyl-tRNA(Asn)/glutamyl-tRNA(Gln) amidotransferase subunit C